jgi:hypothetical protein
MGTGGEWVLAVLAGLAGLVAGAICGLWVGARGLERATGHPALGGIIALFAIAGVAMYTFGGRPDELFTRFATLPLTLLIGIGSAAILVGVPMYAGYLLGYRLGRSRK